MSTFFTISKSLSLEYESHWIYWKVMSHEVVSSIVNEWVYGKMWTNREKKIEFSNIMARIFRYFGICEWRWLLTFEINELMACYQCYWKLFADVYYWLPADTLRLKSGKTCWKTRLICISQQRTVSWVAKLIFSTWGWIDFCISMPHSKNAARSWYAELNKRAQSNFK